MVSRDLGEYVVENLVAALKSSIKTSSGLLLVIYLGNVNSAGVAVGIERTQAIHYLTSRFIHPVLL